MNAPAITVVRFTTPQAAAASKVLPQVGQQAVETPAAAQKQQFFEILSPGRTWPNIARLCWISRTRLAMTGSIVSANRRGLAAWAGDRFHCSASAWVKWNSRTPGPD